MTDALRNTETRRTAHGAPIVEPGAAGLLAGLRLLRLRFELELQDAAQLPGFMGYTLRGAIGYALRARVCPLPHVACSDCWLRERCVYPAFFPAEGGSFAPSGFALQPPSDRRTRYPAGGQFSLDVSLFGAACDGLPAVMQAIEAAGQAGLGADMSRYRVARVMTLTPNQSVLGSDIALDGIRLDPAISLADYRSANARPKALRLTLLTPLVLKRSAGRAALPFDVLVRSLLDRGALLLRAFQGIVHEGSRAALASTTTGVRAADQNLHWVDDERFSTRTQQRIPLRGLLGHIHYEGDLEPWLGLLNMGRHLQLGNKTSHGFGGYTIDVVD